MIKRLIRVSNGSGSMRTIISDEPLMVVLQRAIDQLKRNNPEDRAFVCRIIEIV